jgi:uncharacterized protein (DUF58 family)
MPTARATALLVAALLLYFFANQTQVGWIYVMAALLAGTVLAAWWLGRKALKGITLTRTIAPSDPPHEGETVSVTLTFNNTRSDSHIRTTEECPFADPETAAHLTSIFIPSLPPKTPIQLSYDVLVDRRGLHEYPPLKLTTPAPFGLFRRQRTVTLPTRLLAYPEVKPLHRLTLFDRQPTAQHTHPRPGFGSEFIGVRPYRPGDSPRHIHWRSTARTNQLISKEFADDTQPGLTLVLDLFAHRSAIQNPKSEIGNPKHSSFEWSVKIAASIGDYALRRGYALHLVADDTALPPPPGPLSRIALLEYLARVQPTGTNQLTKILNGRATQTFVAVVLPWPDESILESLVAIKQRGYEVLAVVLDPNSFPTGGARGQSLVSALTANDLSARLIQFGSDWRTQLEPARRNTEYAIRDTAY